jgi:4-alpha-glucanotransferase
MLQDGKQKLRLKFSWPGRTLGSSTRLRASLCGARLARSGSLSSTEARLPQTGPNMDQISERAARWGIATEYDDGLGRRRIVEPHVLALILDNIGASGEPARRMLPQIAVVREGSDRRLRLDLPAGGRVRWDVSADKLVAAGESTQPAVALPEDVPTGCFRLRVTATSPDGERDEDATLLVAPRRAYQGDRNGPRRSWALAVQLYGLRSRRNWGHGDFTDLSALIDLARELGAGGIGLNPLHALFDDRAEQASPYFPSSRFFLNALYIDVEAVAEFRGAANAVTQAELEALRRSDLVDYAGVARAKLRALALAFESFRKHASGHRQDDFQRFRQERGPALARFACFEVLRRRFDGPWWEWPVEWQTPDDEALDRLRRSDADAVAYHEFVQWLADRQLAACRDQARTLGLPIGLYLDVAVGVRADGFDAWNDQDLVLPSLDVGAPADLLNREGQKWGLAGVNPVTLVERGCEPFRQVLQATMQYAGAIRLDHVLGLKRLYLVPRGMKADRGTYIDFPFAALLAVIAQESVNNKCIVIGEDLGTVPEGFREALSDWGLWSYQLMLFERAADGGFIAPENYRENALVTFATHDLPTFAGWMEGRDLAVKRTLGLDPGESEHERAAAQAAMRRTLAARGLHTLDFPSVAQFLAATPSRLAVVALEDALGLLDQVNVPGTIDEQPNWRRRLPVSLEDLKRENGLRSAAMVMASAGRGLSF